MLIAPARTSFCPCTQLLSRDGVVELETRIRSRRASGEKKSFLGASAVGLVRAIAAGVCSVAFIAAATGAEDGLVGYWKFDKAGGRIADLSGHGHDATLVGGKLGKEDGKPALRLDGKQKISVPSHADLQLAKGFSIETRFRVADLRDGRLVVFKDGQYNLRIDWPNEGQKLSFFVYAGGQWEPRASSYPLTPGQTYHVVAVWDGRVAYLWVNGEPFSTAHPGDLPPPNDNPLCIGSGQWEGANFTGRIEYVKIYRRALSTAEIIQRAYGIRPSAEGGTEQTEFDFSRGLQGWHAVEDATADLRGSRLVLASRTNRGMLLNSEIRAGVDKKDYLSLRMAVDRGTRGELVFVTAKGAGRVPFSTQADRKPHTYVFEPWTWAGWGGRLLALGLIPSEEAGSRAAIEYLRLSEQLRAEPELEVTRVLPQSTLPRCGREEEIIARVRNRGGKATGLTATLAVPSGVALRGPTSQPVADLDYLDEKEVAWKIEASSPVSGQFRVDLVHNGSEAAGGSQAIRFLANPQLAKASYVPEPVPARTGKYTLWTHYCPLWKQGTHYGWKLIEPWPERKPVIGWYNEGEPEVADWQIKYWVEHGISGVVYCWYRTNLNGPVTQQIGHAIHDGLLKARYIDRIKFAIMWENGCGQGVGSSKDLMENVLPFWIENYFSHPSYQRVDGKPLLYIWVPSNVTKHLGSSEEVRKTFDLMRAVCKQKGLGGLYIVGCVGSQNRDAVASMAQEGWDATSAYGCEWRQPPQVRTVGDFICAPFEGFVDQQEAIWKSKQGQRLLPDITAAMMGWDSRPWKETPFFWSENTPEKFRDLCLRAKKVLDANPGSGPEKTIIFCCWNEFGEGHYIEPTRGYGFSYLDAIRDVFAEGSKEHLDIAPEDVGLGPYDSWYRQAREAAAGQSAARDSWSGRQLAAWNAMMNLADVKCEGDVLRARASGDDPALTLDGLRLRASRYKRVVVEMRVSQPGGAQVFWATATDPFTSEALSATVPTVADGQFHTYAFDVGKFEQWSGCVTTLRLDPTSHSGVVVEIRSIRLE